MDHYEIWCNLGPGVKDTDFVRSVQAYLDHLKARVGFPSYQITRRKLGFGIEGLGEFHIRISFENLTQLDDAFKAAAERRDPVEGLHQSVYSIVTDFKAALYRDYPDENLETEKHPHAL